MAVVLGGMWWWRDDDNRGYRFRSLGIIQIILDTTAQRGKVGGEMKNITPGKESAIEPYQQTPSQGFQNEKLNALFNMQAAASKQSHYNALLNDLGANGYANAVNQMQFNPKMEPTRKESKLPPGTREVIEKALWNHGITMFLAGALLGFILGLFLAP